jgi:hypothetical protein
MRFIKDSQKINKKIYGDNINTNHGLLESTQSCTQMVCWQKNQEDFNRQSEVVCTDSLGITEFDNRT